MLTSTTYYNEISYCTVDGAVGNLHCSSRAKFECSSHVNFMQSPLSYVQFGRIKVTKYVPEKCTKVLK